MADGGRAMNADPLVRALLRTRRLLQPDAVSDDLRTITRQGGRDADVFYRDRWSHDRIVRSTHGVNCTGSCSWKVYVKDDIITWETQETDYPTVGPDSPEYEPRGCPRGAAFSWYTYSPTRVRYPYVRGVLLEAYREAKARLGDPVAAWADVVGDPERRSAYMRARGKGGLVRVHWDEALEMIAAAQVHTIRAWGPDRITAFSPIPAMSMVSYAAGARYTSLIGGTVLSFYDWYADLPIAAPQVFGDQTDVPESADWWNASYLVMWGSNLPVTRTPDAHFMTEARYRGQKVVVVSPDYADNTKFADEWLPAQPGTDGALAMAMGHVILRECFVEREVERFRDYVKRYTDLPFLVTLREREDVPGAFVPDRFLTAADLGRSGGGGRLATVLLDAATGEPVVPNGSLGDRLLRPGWAAGTWTWAGVDPPLSLLGRGEAVAVDLPRFDVNDGPNEGGSVLRRGVPVRRVDDRLVTTVFDLLLAQYGVGRPGLPGEWPAGYDDPAPYTPAWQEEITGVPAATVTRIAREFADERRALGRPLDDRHGRRHQPLVPLRPDLPGDARADHADRLPGRQRRRLGALRRPGEDPPAHRLDPAGVRPRLGPPAAPDGRHGVLVSRHRPVALRRLRGRRAGHAARAGASSRAAHSPMRWPSRPGWAGCLVPDLRPQPARPGRRGATRRRATRWRTPWISSGRGELRFACEDPDARRTSRGC